MDVLDMMAEVVRSAEVSQGNLISIRIGRSMYEKLIEGCRRRLGGGNDIIQIVEFMGLPLAIIDGEDLGQMFQVVSGLKNKKEEC